MPQSFWWISSAICPCASSHTGHWRFISQLERLVTEVVAAQQMQVGDCEPVAAAKGGVSLQKLLAAMEETAALINCKVQSGTQRLIN